MRISDWSSDVCSSDLGGFNLGFGDRVARVGRDSIASINPEYAFDLGVRAGYLVSDNTLLYARGGYENVRASVRLTDAAGTRRDKDSFDGWTIGGGVERDRKSTRLNSSH